MICTVNDIRVRLGKILEGLFTPELNEKYVAFRPEIPEQIMLDYSEQTDQIVSDLSKHLRNKPYCRNLLNTIPIEVFFTFFMRYHFLTCYLKAKPQGSPANMPEKDSIFFEILLNSMWKFALES